MQNGFSIGSQQVHLWRCDLRLIDARDASRSLSAEEHARAAAFVFDRDRDRYRAGRALLRGLLSSYTGTAASELQLGAREHAKPQLAGDAIQFNVSHCADIYVLALCAESQIGVDVEAARIVHDAFQLGEMVFSADEKAQLARCESHDINAAFLRGWTRKEAYIKALGVGLGGVDLQAITVGLDLAARIVPPLAGIAERALEIQSHQRWDEFVATASELIHPEFICRDVDASVLMELAL